MRKENAEIVRDAVRARRRGLDAAAEFWHPQIDWRAANGAPDDVGPIVGIEAMRAFAQDWIDCFDDLRLDLEELIDVGEQVVAVQRLSGRAKASGIETELRYAVVYTIHDGKIVRGREYWGREEALDAARRCGDRRGARFGPAPTARLAAAKRAA